VEPAYREQGRATALGAALLETTLARGKVPHWDAANLESVRLAKKLGYRPAGTYEAHWLVI
jgi:predicted GNAT family acetyltransferase